MSITFVPTLGLIERARGSDVNVEPPWFRLLLGDRPLLFVVPGSQIFELDQTTAAQFQKEHALEQFRSQLAMPERSAGRPTKLLPPISVSLNLAQACNLSCSYCYADEGRFGGEAKLMPLDVALAAVDVILDRADAQRRVTIGFIGGEPFLNRKVLRETVRHARTKARLRRLALGFSVTTNGTLLTEDDVSLLRDEAFAVTVSLDGAGSLNDVHRKARGGSAGALALDRVRPLLEKPGRCQVAARATIARDDLRVAERVEGLTAAGFREVGVSPLRASADAKLGLRHADWPAFLAEMVRAADREWDRVRQGGAWRFGNLAIAFKELHRGAVKSLPCGAADGYLSADADGQFAICHRAVGNAQFRLGDVHAGPNNAARLAFVAEHDVDRQEPCRSCWARYLCGGGCHVEVSAVGRTGCDYIRGWLEYCIRLYPEASAIRPDLFPGLGEDHD
jgi:uncharacterized protein